MTAYRCYTGQACKYLVDIVSQMRMTYFREYPYLYDSSDAIEYEKQYIHALAEDPHALIVIATLNGEIVASSTSLPLCSNADILADLETPFRSHDYLPEEFYYYGEIIVAPAQRGHGIATRLYALRQQHALQWGYRYACLASVLRDENDPRKPLHFEKPSPVWMREGFQKTSIVFDYHWPTFQVDGQSADTANPMEIWIKPLS